MAVFNSSTTSSSNITATSSIRRAGVTPMNHANGSDMTSAASSSRKACSERAAKMSPFRVLMVARQKRSTLETCDRRHWFHLACALLLEQFSYQESHIDRLLCIEPRVANRVITVVEVLVGD